MRRSRLWILALSFPALVCLRAWPGTEDAPPRTGRPDAPQAANPLSGALRELLIRPCGSCHRSTLASSKPGALAVFDLDQTEWDRWMSDAQAEEMARRARGSDGLDPADRTVIEDYLRQRALLHSDDGSRKR